MKVLWFSNIILSESDPRSTGTWLFPMAKSLSDSGEIDLFNIAQSDVSKITWQECGSIKQLIVPAMSNITKRGLPKSPVIDDIITIVNDLAPDIIHVWGTEGYWGLLTARKLQVFASLLEIQGLKGVYSRVYSGGLTLGEQMMCIGLKEIVRKSMIHQGRKQFSQWGKYENEIIRGHRFISTQSEWTRAWIRSINPECNILNTQRPLRDAFYTAEPWQAKREQVLFTSVPYPVPYKGLHVIIRAVKIVKKRFPNIRLRIAGALQKKGLRRDTYIKWVNKEVKHHGLESNIDWLGPLSAPEIAEELRQCAVYIMPSFIETYCLAFAEAMMLGVPSVVTYTGGTSYLARDEESALFFYPGDEAVCAFQVERILTDRNLAQKLSRKSREIAVVRNDKNNIVKQQLINYQQILDSVNQFKKP